MIHIVMEDDVTVGTWRYRIVEGIVKAAKQKRAPYAVETGNFASDPTDLIAIVGVSPSWICQTVSRAQRDHSAHIVQINARASQTSVSSICTDLFLSMKNVIGYLTDDCGKRRIAFYGANPASSADLQKLRGFGESDRVYYNHGDLRQCYETFARRVDEYDAVVCANDYAAVSLLQNLKEKRPSEVDRLFLVGFANTHIARLYTPSVTTVALNYYEYGQAAVRLYEALQKHGDVSSADVYIKSDILVRATTKFIPYAGRSVAPEPVSPDADPDFFDDAEIRDVVSIEKMLEIADATDLAILDGVANGKPYETVAQETFLSTNGVKYRLGRLWNGSGVPNRKAFLRAVRTYFRPDVFRRPL